MTSLVCQLTDEQRQHVWFGWMDGWMTDTLGRVCVCVCVCVCDVMGLVDQGVTHWRMWVHVHTHACLPQVHKRTYALTFAACSRIHAQAHTHTGTHT